MSIEIGAKPDTTPTGTSNVKIVAWDSTGAGSLPAGTANIGAVSIVAGTATQTILGIVSVTNTAGPFTISGTVSNIPITTQGPYYQQNATAIAATGTGVLIMGVQSGATTARGWAFTTSAAGHVFVDNSITMAGTAVITGSVTATLVASAPAGDQLMGTVNNIQVVTAGPYYQQNATAIAATGTGVLVMGLQSGATTSRAMMITTSGDQRTFIVNSLQAGNVLVGSFNIVGSVPAGAVLIGSMNIVGSIPAGNVLVGSVNVVGSIPAGAVIIGSVNVVGVTTTADAFNIRQGGSFRYLTASTAVQFSRINIVTSGDNILVASAANKSVVVLSLMINGNGANTAIICSSASAKPIGPTMFIATSGVGMVLGQNDDGWFRTTVAESLVINVASSGSVSGCLTYVAVTT